jgi:hypothetical protein
MVVVLFVDGRRQQGIHGGVPLNRFGAVAEKCPIGSGGSVATVVADQTGDARADRDRTVVSFAGSALEAEALRSVGENSEGADARRECWCANHHGRTPFLCTGGLLP